MLRTRRTPTRPDAPDVERRQRLQPDSFDVVREPRDSAYDNDRHYDAQGDEGASNSG